MLCRRGGVKNKVQPRTFGRMCDHLIKISRGLGAVSILPNEKQERTCPITSKPLAIFFLLLFAVLCPPANAQERKAVFIILDGIPADVLEKIETPALDEIASRVGYTRAFVGGTKGGYDESPTISSPGYNHLLTGVWTHKHNVWDNDIEAPNYHYWNIFRIVRTVRPEARIAVFSSWQDNRTKLIGEGLPEAGSVKMDYSYDGLELDTVRFPHDPDRRFMLEIDEAVSKEAARYILEKGPDLSWVYLEFTDDMGHMHGDSPELYDAVRSADTQVGRIWKSLRDREATYQEDWMIVITTDHGRDAKTGKDHGGQSERERTTWIVTNLDTLNERFSHTPAVVDIMPSILRFMDIPLPQSVREEIDGIPFTGMISVSDLRAQRKGNRITLTWNVMEPDGTVEIFAATSNNFREGKPDSYISLGKVDVAKGRFTFKVSPGNSYRKILIKAPHNWANVWL